MMNFIHSCEVIHTRGYKLACNIHFKIHINSNLCSITVYVSNCRKFYKFQSHKTIQYYKQLHDLEQLIVKYFENDYDTSIMLMTDDKCVIESIEESKEDSLIHYCELEKKLECELMIIRDNIRFVETLYPTCNM